MTFKSEKAFQDWYASTLSKAHLEVQTALGRIDILTPDSIIECKTKLTRESGYQAAGQLYSYRPFFPDRKLVVAVPEIEDEQAKRRLEASGIEVICASPGLFGKVVKGGKQKGELNGLSLALIVVAIYILALQLRPNEIAQVIRCDELKGYDPKVVAVIKSEGKCQ